MKDFSGKIKRRLDEEFSSLVQNLHEKWSSHSPPSRFVIVCNIRTGSTMLQNLLNSHPNARCFFELFHRHKTSIAFGVKGYRRKNTDKILVNLRNENPVLFLEQQIFSKQPKYIQAVGFKLLYSQCRRGRQWWDEPEYDFWWEDVGPEPKWEGNTRYLWDFLAEERIPIIHLTRNNLLESKVSALIAQHTGQWGIGATGGMRTQAIPKKIRLDIEEFEKDLRGEELFRKEVRKRFAQSPMLEVTYEDLIGAQKKELSRVLKFLGLNNYELNTPTQKLRDYNLPELIENYSDLKSYFSGSPFEFMFIHS